MRDRNDDVARLHSCRHQRKSNGVSSVGHADAVFRVTKCGEFCFEIFDHCAAHKTSGAQHLLKYSSELGLELLVWCDQIQERNLFGKGHYAILDSSVMYRNSLAGFPATMAFAGTSLVTTLPAPTIAFSPIVTFASIVEPDPIEAPFLTTVFSTFQSASVCNWPSAAVARG